MKASVSKWNSKNKYRHNAIFNICLAWKTRPRWHGSVFACPALWGRKQVLSIRVHCLTYSRHHFPCLGGIVCIHRLKMSYRERKATWLLCCLVLFSWAPLCAIEAVELHKITKSTGSKQPRRILKNRRQTTTKNTKRTGGKQPQRILKEQNANSHKEY